MSGVENLTGKPAVSKKICLLSDHHLSINPRLWKEAFFYEKQGFEVVVITMWQSKDLLQRDLEILKGHAIIYKAYLNLIPGEINSITRFFYRLRKRLAGEVQRFFKIGTGWAISHAPELMFQKALQENADLYAAHLECAFFVGKGLINAGKKVSFDFEDWYSRDYLTSDRATRLLSKLEAFALERGTFCTATSMAMATALSLANPAFKKPTPIYNSFPDEELNGFSFPVAENISKPFSVIWTSRTVGPERGLETFVEALYLLNHPIDLHIIGKCAEGYEQSLRKGWPVNKGHQLIFHDFIRHVDLLKQIATFDLGLAIEQYLPDSRNKTITNKILQYLQAGIMVLATDTDGQKEVASHFPDTVFTIPADRPTLWKEALEKIISNGRETDKLKQLQQFKTYYSWPVQEEKLKLLISDHL